MLLIAQWYFSRSAEQMYSTILHILSITIRLKDPNTCTKTQCCGKAKQSRQFTTRCSFGSFFSSFHFILDHVNVKVTFMLNYNDSGCVFILVCSWVCVINSREKSCLFSLILLLHHLLYCLLCSITWLRPWAIENYAFLIWNSLIHICCCIVIVI